MALITCDNITLSYNRQPIVSNLSLSVSKGDYLCVVGENGVGKSTLVKGILGLLRPVSGKIVYGDSLLKNEIGYLPQQSQIQKDFPASVKEVIEMGCLNRCKKLPFFNSTQKEIIRKNAELLGITELMNSCYQELSGGQQQRVLLARALCSAEKVVLLDEPVQGLDPVVTNEMYDIIKKLNKEYSMAIIMVSHDVNQAIKNATHILHLDHNDIFYGTVDEYVSVDVSSRFLHQKGGKSK